MQPHSGREVAQLIEALPKAELHIHIEGTLEPELMLELAQRNGVALPYGSSLEAARAARAHYGCLQDFLDEYYAASSVLLTEQDFYDLASTYLSRAAANNIKHAEIFFDPQSHTRRGVAWATFFPGLLRAVCEAPAVHGLTATLIMCFLRDLGPQAAAECLEQAKPYLEHIAGVGLCSTEVGIAPSLFKDVFEQAAKLGLHRVAHAGEEAGPDYIREAIACLGLERVDHGIHCIEDPGLVAELERSRLPLTACPLSNLQLKVYAGELEERYRQLLASDILVTINSDDPAFFHGYLNANYEYVAGVAALPPARLAALAANGFEASFISGEAKAAAAKEVAAALALWEARQRGGGGGGGGSMSGSGSGGEAGGGCGGAGAGDEDSSEASAPCQS